MLTIARLLADPALELRLLVAGSEEALRANVVWVHNTELPDPSPYLRARELVLTNGLWLATTQPAEFVANVQRAGAAGIIFGLRAALDRTPPALIEACQAAGLPLVEISVDVPFTEVSRAAAAIYAEQRQEALARMVQRGNALAAALSHGAGASGVLDVLRRDRDLPLAVVDRMGGQLASWRATLNEAQRRTVADALARRPPPLEVELDGASSAALFPVGAVGAPDAALLCLRPIAELSRADREVLDQATLYLSLEVARQQAVQSIEMRFASELLDMILSGAQRAGEVPGRLRAFGVEPDGVLAVCALALAATEPAVGGADGSATMPGMTEAATEHFLAAGLPAVVADGSQDIVAILPWRQGQAELTKLAARLADALTDRFSGRRVVVGLGELARNAAELRRPLLQCREACRVLRRRRGGSTVATFAELGTYRLLLETHDTDQLRGFADSILSAMRAYDRRRGGELEMTLRAFFDNDGQWNATAAALYIHVNTLRNRLAKITELTGRDVGKTSDRVDLFLALEASAPRPD